MSEQEPGSTGGRPYGEQTPGHYGQSGYGEQTPPGHYGQGAYGYQAPGGQQNPYAAYHQGWAQQGAWTTQQFPQTPYHKPQQPKPLRSAAIAIGAIGLSVVLGLGIGHFVWTPGSGSASGNQNFGSVAPPGGTSNTSIDADAIAKKVDPALVDVNTQLGYQSAIGAGTGIVLTSDGEILTNNHVVEGATSIKVTDIGNGKTYTASVLGYDRSHDIAVIKLNGASGLKTATLGNSSSVQSGDAVVGIGNAGGAGGTPAVAPGKVTGLNQSITASDEATGSSEKLAGLIQVDANIQSGDSGGPLVNSQGQVIGVDTAASQGFQFNGGQGRRGFGGGLGQGQGGLGQGQGGLGQGDPGQGFGGFGQGDPQQGTGQGGLGQGGVGQGQGQQGGSGGNQGFAVPINQAIDLAHQIIGGKASDTVHIGESAFLGVSVSDAGQQAPGGLGQGGQDQNGQSQGGQSQGAAIQQVVPGGPAESAGLAAGDVITAVDGKPVDSATTLTTLMDTHHPGDKLTVTVVDQAGQKHDVALTPAAGPVG